jgi:hypothetical protein
MIDFSRWSLNRKKVTIQRYHGAYADGVFNRTLISSTEVWASAQPYKTIEGDLISDPTRGENVEKPLILFTNNVIYMNDTANPEYTISDLVIVDGRKWKPISVDNWTFQGLPHYRSVLQLFDGY